MRVMVIGKATNETEAQNSPLDMEGAAELSFAETKELVAGYSIWQVRSMEEAVEWAKRLPNPMSGPSEVEIRPLWEPEDFDGQTWSRTQAGAPESRLRDAAVPSLRTELRARTADC